MVHNNQNERAWPMGFQRILGSILGFCLMSLPVTSVAQSIAITIDDLPYVMPSRTTPEDGLRYVQSINQALEKHGILAVGFAFGAQITTESTPALQAFADAGHIIGNHSWSHSDYDTLTIDAFREETLRTDRALSQWIDNHRYYRFPYLRQGKTEDTRNAAKQVLADLGYRNVPVTIDNDDWRFNAAYLDAIEQGDTTAAERISTEYLAHMQERTVHFQALAHEVLGRDAKHILLLHMNRINADHLETLLDWHALEGWTFITVEEAMSDPLYSAPDLYTGARGLSQIERIMGYESD